MLQTRTSLDDIIALLLQTSQELYPHHYVTFRCPPATPEHPLEAQPADDWVSVASQGTFRMRAGEPNWYYAEEALPEELHGIALAGSQVYLFIHGGAPFTCWLNGEELFREAHVWYATGPIVDPLPLSTQPGQRYRLVLSMTPTAAQGEHSLPWIEFKFSRVMDISVEVGAAALQLRLAAALAATPEEHELLKQATACIDPDDLRARRWEPLLAAIARLEALLQPFAARARAYTMHLLGHTHIDMDWTWTWEDTEYCIRRDFNAFTEIMRDYPDVTLTHSQVPTYATVKEKDPAIFAAVQQFVAEGRWENAAGTWVEGDLHMADGEAIARHMLYAKDWTREHLGTEARVLWEPDTFGHPGNIPQLAALGEFDCYFASRCNPGGEQHWPVRHWIGIDGTPLLTFGSDYSGALHPWYLTNALTNALRFNLRNSFFIWGWGDHGGGISRFQYSLLQRFKDKPVMPTFRFSTMQQLLTAIREEGTPLPSNTGETYHLFEGCFTSHARMKQYNRQCESALLTAETLCALAGLERTTGLRDAWTPALFNQFHDIFDGASVHEAYVNAYARAESTLATARSLTAEALGTPTATGTTLTLTNPLGFPRCEPVYTELPPSTHSLLNDHGEAIPVQRLGDTCVFIAAQVPAFGQQRYRLSENAVPCAAIPVTEDAQYFTVETETAIARISKQSGAIASYYDKALARELVGYGVPKPITYGCGTRMDLALNVFQVLDEAPNGMAAWIINDILREESLLRDAEVTLAATGPVCARFIVQHAFRSSTIREEITFYRTLPRVDFNVEIDWQEVGNATAGVPALKLAFTVPLDAPRLRCEGPFSVVTHAPDGQEQVTQKWADLSGTDAGFAILNDARYGCDALGGRLRISLLRNAYAPDPDSDTGRHTIRFAFLPHNGQMRNGELVRQGMAFNRALLASTDGATMGMPGFHIAGAESVVCTALRHAEYSAGVLCRLFESGGTACQARIALGQPVRDVRIVNFLEHPTGETVAVTDGEITLSFRPFEVKTLLLA